jgi:uncharacterized membrane-anchored protein
MMLEWYHWLLTVIALAALSLSVFYSFSYRRRQDHVLRGLYAAKMNIYMGLMLLDIAVLQVSLFEMSSLRLVLSTLFALIGLFNLFAGRKNLGYYQSLQKKAA